ncbi:MAG: hypothetical protein IPI43_32335 [Sandaracinaceae bacterium]|nr:hypothetical protein [Sandaracinaceae bacterium]
MSPLPPVRCPLARAPPRAPGVAARFRPGGPAGAQATTLDHPSTPHADVLELTFEEAIDLALVRPEARVAEQVRARRADADADVGRWVGNPRCRCRGPAPSPAA